MVRRTNRRHNVTTFCPACGKALLTPTGYCDACLAIIADKDELFAALVKAEHKLNTRKVT